MPEEPHGLNPDDFEQFDWKGQTRYKCTLFWESGTKCEYDTYDLGMMKEHLRMPHLRKVFRESRSVRPIPVYVAPPPDEPIPVYVAPPPDEEVAKGKFKDE